MHGSQKCCGKLVELTVDDIWQISDAGDRELRRQAHSIHDICLLKHLVLVFYVL